MLEYVAYLRPETNRERRSGLDHHQHMPTSSRKGGKLAEIEEDLVDPFCTIHDTPEKQGYP
jgi:hypothetical protein